MQEKGKRQATEEKLFLAEKKNKEKFFQMWRQTEREKEQLLRSKMTKDKKSTNNRFISSNSSKNAVAMESLREIPRKMINLENDSKDLTLGEGKFGKVTLASY